MLANGKGNKCVDVDDDCAADLRWGHGGRQASWTTVYWRGEEGILYASLSLFVVTRPGPAKAGVGTCHDGSGSRQGWPAGDKVRPGPLCTCVIVNHVQTGGCYCTVLSTHRVVLAFAVLCVVEPQASAKCRLFWRVLCTLCKVFLAPIHARVPPLPRSIDQSPAQLP